MTDIDVVPRDAADDEALVEQLVRVINEAYAIGEAGLWLDGATRIGPGEIGEAIRSGTMLSATSDGQLVGCVFLRPLDARSADLGLLSVAPDQWGNGVGRELVHSAEKLMRSEVLIFRKPLRLT
jgi:hypothetical protein